MPADPLPPAVAGQPYRPPSLRGFAALLGDAGHAWLEDNVQQLSASLAFYAVLALVPCLLVVTTLAAGTFGQKAASGQLMWDIQDLVGMAGAKAIQDLIRSASHSSTAATVLGLLTLAFGASAVVMELRDALNAIWHVPAVGVFSSVQNFLNLVRERFYLFGLILGAGLMMVIFLALSTLMGTVSPTVGSHLDVTPVAIHVTVFVVSFLVVTVLFAAIYKLVPDVPLDWNDVIVGSCFTAFLFTAGKQLIGLYLANVGFGSTYGVAGSMLVVLVWVYYSAQLFFFGAEFTKVYARNARHKPVSTGVAARTPVNLPETTSSG